MTITTCWEVPTILFNAMEFAKNNTGAVEGRKGFETFLGNVVNNLLAAEDFTLSQDGKAGGFPLPEGYNGMTSDGYGVFFDVVYCSLAMKIEEEIIKGSLTLEDLIAMWKSSIMSGQDFTVDTLATYVNVHIKFDSFDYVFDAQKLVNVMWTI